MAEQITSNILMIRPVAFGYNVQTADTNAFQKNPGQESQENINASAQGEFDTFVKNLHDDGVNLFVFNDSLYPHTPDSIFPNNWVTFHEDGRVVLYPMEAENRRLERKLHIIDSLRDDHRFEIKEIIDLSGYEKEGKFLEGTGSMVIDSQAGIVYACLSPRTDMHVLNVFCSMFDYHPVVFRATDTKGVPVYHTNVMMALGIDFAVICLESIPKPEERQKVIDSLINTGKEIVEISLEQMNRFAGNMLQVKTNDGKPLLVLSDQACNSLGTGQLEKLQSKTAILKSPLNTIERYGGGSARCMMAEIFTRKKPT